MRIMYFGENKEEGTERVAVIRFTDDEFDLYKYIENYEHTYGDNTRKFAIGGLIGIERNEKGVWINESYISVDNFSDFNDFKANYKEAPKILQEQYGVERIDGFLIDLGVLFAMSRASNVKFCCFE